VHNAKHHEAHRIRVQYLKQSALVPTSNDTMAFITTQLFVNFTVQGITEPSLCSVLSQFNPIYTFTTYYSGIYLRKPVSTSGVLVRFLSTNRTTKMLCTLHFNIVTNYQGTTLVIKQNGLQCHMPLLYCVQVD